MKNPKKLQHLSQIKLEIQRKTKFVQQKKTNLSGSSLSKRERIKSEGLPEVYLHEKSTMRYIKFEEKGYNEVGTYFRYTKNVSQELKKTHILVCASQVSNSRIS